MAKVQVDPLPSDVAVSLTAFARACKGAARAVALYPPEHPAVGGALERLTSAARTATSSGPLTMLVIPDNLLVDGRVLERPDLAVASMAALLHNHRVGEITIQGDVALPAWRTFVTLLGQDPDTVYLHGGLARALTTEGGIGISVTEIDYGTLFEADGADSRAPGDQVSEGPDSSAAWASVVSRCLEHETFALDDSTLHLLGEITHDSARVAQFFERVEAQAGHRSPQEQSHALLGTMQEVVDFLRREAPADLDVALANTASAFSRLSPEFVLQLVGTGGAAGSEHAPLVADLTSRIDDRTLAQFMARSVVRERSASARLAEALRLLAPDPGRRRAMAPLVHEELSRTEVSGDSSVDSLWSQAADMLTTYGDAAYVPSSYDRELTTAQHRATDRAQGSDDPPELVIGWLKTVSDVSIRELDMQMLADLLAVQHDPERRREALDLVMAQVDDLVDLGDFDGARQLVDAAAGQSASMRAAGRPDDIGEAIERLARGPFMSRVASHLQAARDSEFEQARALCAAVGPALVPKLAAILSTEERPRARRRLADLIMLFGGHSRESVQQLVESPNPGVRRTAVHLLRLIGGPESAPGLVRLAADADGEVRRDAARAIIGLGIDQSFDALLDILDNPRHPGRATIIDEVATTRDHRATQLLCHLVQHLECRGEMTAIYLRCLARLGVLGGQDAVDALDDILHRGCWWAPLRTRKVRAAAAAALARIELPTGREVLQKAVEAGSFGVRAVARKYLRNP
jgi:HEAT repeat protein